MNNFSLRAIEIVVLNLLCFSERCEGRPLSKMRARLKTCPKPLCLDTKLNFWIGRNAQ